MEVTFRTITHKCLKLKINEPKEACVIMSELGSMFPSIVENRKKERLLIYGNRTFRDKDIFDPKIVNSEKFVIFFQLNSDVADNIYEDDSTEDSIMSENPYFENNPIERDSFVPDNEDLPVARVDQPMEEDVNVAMSMYNNEPGTPVAMSTITSVNDDAPDYMSYSGTFDIDIGDDFESHLEEADGGISSDSSIFSGVSLTERNIVPRINNIEDLRNLDILQNALAPRFFMLDEFFQGIGSNKQLAQEPNDGYDKTEEISAMIMAAVGLGYNKEDVLKSLKIASGDKEYASQILLMNGFNDEPADLIGIAPSIKENENKTAVLCNSLYFENLRTDIQTNATLLEEYIEKVAQHDPEFIEVIKRNESIFMNLINMPCRNVEDFYEADPEPMDFLSSIVPHSDVNYRDQLMNMNDEILMDDFRYNEANQTIQETIMRQFEMENQRNITEADLSLNDMTKIDQIVEMGFLRERAIALYLHNHKNERKTVEDLIVESGQLETS
uniref:UBA domain-containing protein n=1 Tax=Rhabditophanes sp. KR3021 TaxID=114890 RepID=A0AC35TY39_9BILA